MDTAYRTGDLIWARPQPPSRTALAPLSRDAIVAAAMELADADGLESVSIRKVAGALGAGPMRLYGYLDTKDDLLDLMVDAAFGEVARELPGERGWRDRVRAVATEIRRVALRHEWFVDLLGGRPHLGPHALVVLEVAAAGLADAPGLSEVDELWSALGTLNAYIVGAVRREVSERRTARSSGLDEQAWQSVTGPYLQRRFEAGELPTLGRLVRDGSPLDPAVAFAQGLDDVLAGLGARRRQT